MKERTVSRRNLLGAFLGGVLGILACGFFNAFLLPVGVFAGVIVGWWYQEILASTMNGFHTGILMARSLGVFLFTPAHRLSEWRKKLWRELGDLDPPLLLFLAWVATPFIWLLRRPMAGVLWICAHPLHRAYLVLAAILPVFYTIATAVIGSLALVLHWTAQGVDMKYSFWSVPVMAAGVMLFCLYITSLVMPFMIWSESENEQKFTQMRRIYRVWKRYTSMGALRFYGSELRFITHLWFSGMTWVIACFAWFCGIGGIFLGTMALMSAAVGFVKGVYRVSTRAGHWFCFGVTLTTTIIAAALFRPFFEDLQFLLDLALLTGVISAIATEGLRRGLLLLFKTWRQARAIALIPLEHQLRPGGHLFWRISTGAGDWFKRSFLPVRPKLA